MTDTNIEKLVDSWEDRRDVKNLMGRYVHYLLLKKESAIFKDLWSSRDDVSYGVNGGFYKGKAAVEGYFGCFDAHTAKVASLLKAQFPDKLGALSDEEIFGTGLLELKSVSNHIIEVADDGMTAKAYGCVTGFDTTVDGRGPVSHWIFGVMALDLVLENDQWKIWHMLYLEDINNPSGSDWGKKDLGEPYPQLAEFAEIKDWAPAAPNVKVQLREKYSGTRPFTKLPPTPVPYNTFADTFSYGPKED